METDTSDITGTRGMHARDRKEGWELSSEEEIRIYEEAFERSDYEKVG